MRRSIAGCGSPESLLFAAACSSGAKPGAPLPSVYALPKPTLPPWIASVSPAGAKAQSLAQIRVIFNKPVTKVEALSGAGPEDVLAHVSIDAAVSRSLRLPYSAYDRLRRRPGVAGRHPRPRHALSRLADLDGDTLASDLPGRSKPSRSPSPASRKRSRAPASRRPRPLGLKPTITITSNAKAVEASLASHVTMSASGTTLRSP